MKLFPLYIIIWTVILLGWRRIGCWIQTQVNHPSVEGLLQKQQKDFRNCHVGQLMAVCVMLGSYVENNAMQSFLWEGELLFFIKML